jgi:hypothetical protein
MAIWCTLGWGGVNVGRKAKKLLRVLTPTFPDNPRQHRQKLFASFLEKEGLALLSIGQPPRQLV